MPESIELEDKDIRVVKAPGKLHFKLERILSKREYKSGNRPTKSDLVIELLSTHPIMKTV